MGPLVKTNIMSWVSKQTVGQTTCSKTDYKRFTVKVSWQSKIV